MNAQGQVFNNDNSNNGNDEKKDPLPTVARQRQALSKRARIVDFYNTTRTNYLPTITNSISSLVGTDEAYQLPSNSKIALYDTYTVGSKGEYTVNIYGYLYCPGTMNRKNRLLLTLARQLVKSPSSQVADQFQGELGEKLNNPDQYHDGDDESVYSTESSASSSISVNTESILKERLEGFMTRSLPQNAMRVIVGSEIKMGIEQLSQTEVISDDSGHFKLEIKTNYKPSVVQVSCLANEEIVNFKEVKIIDDEPGISLISDIDDTVKMTGVVNDKRDMFRNVFTRNAKDLEVPGFVNWFTAVAGKGCKIHYVSNSPWQLLKPIKNFFETIGLPYSSIHLKQYSGNVIAALMEPASERKKSTLIKIVSDFPHRKFILIGDTGEKDLEAYLTLAKMFPKQILMIYMRVVPKSLSDIGDTYVYDNIMKLARLRQGSALTDEDLIDLESDIGPIEKPKRRRSRLAPIIPKKPTSLKGHLLSPTSSSSFKNTAAAGAKKEELEEAAPPKLPTRRVQTFDIAQSSTKAHPPPRASTDAGNKYELTSAKPNATAEDPADSSRLAPNSVFNMSNIMTNLDIDDKRGDLWRERMIRVMNELPEEVGIRFFKDVDEVIEDSLNIVKSKA